MKRPFPLTRLLAPAIALVVVVVSACGGGKNTVTGPSGAAPSTATPTRIIGLSGSLAFGDVNLGSSRDATLTITNTGSATLSFSGLSVSAGLGPNFAASPTSGQVPPGGSVNVTVRFTPQNAGSVSGTLTIAADHTSGTNTIGFSGTGATTPVTLFGVVTDSNTRRPVGAVTVSVITQSVQNVGRTTTDGNGYYSVVIPSGIPLSVQYSVGGYNSQSSTVTLTRDTQRDVGIVPFWKISGVGNTVFDMPRSVTRVRIIGTYNASGSNFIVWVGGRLVVNEIIGTGRTGGPRYEGVHAVIGGQVEITNSRDVIWSFEQMQ